MAVLKPIAVAAALLAVIAPARAQTASAWNEHPNSKVRLIAGQEGLIGIELQLAPGWKTYWRMPGDAGVPPSFEWEGSENVGGFDVLYPAPIVMTDQGGTAIGYKGHVIFPVKFTRTDLANPAKIAVEFSFGVCKDVCIPVESKLSLSLASGSNSTAELTAALAAVPRPTAEPAKAQPALVSMTHDLVGNAPHITFRTRGAQDVFVEAPDGLFVPLARRTGEQGGIATYVVDLSKSPDIKDLAGKTLRVTVTDGTGGIETALVLK